MPSPDTGGTLGFHPQAHAEAQSLEAQREAQSILEWQKSRPKQQWGES